MRYPTSKVLKLYLVTISALESTSHFVSLKSMRSYDKYIQQKLHIFDPIARVNIVLNTANECKL